KHSNLITASLDPLFARLRLLPVAGFVHHYLRSPALLLTHCLGNDARYDSRTTVRQHLLHFHLLLLLRSRLTRSLHGLLRRRLSLLPRLLYDILDRGPGQAKGASRNGVPQAPDRLTVDARPILDLETGLGGRLLLLHHLIFLVVVAPKNKGMKLIKLTDVDLREGGIDVLLGEADQETSHCRDGRVAVDRPHCSSRGFGLGLLGEELRDEVVRERTEALEEFWVVFG